MNNEYVDYSIARPIPGYAEAKTEAEEKAKTEAKKNDDKKTGEEGTQEEVTTDTPKKGLLDKIKDDVK